MAANVAMEHTIMELYFNSKKDNVRGRKNNNRPVILFMIVCRAMNCLVETYPQMILPILTIAIKPNHIHNHPGTEIAGNSLIIDTDTNAMSATVSILDPNSLALVVFLAMVPSIISLKPQRMYMI